MNELIFAYTAVAQQTDRHALLLAKSIRAFGGRWAQAPIWLFSPDELDDVNPELRDGFNLLDVAWFSFTLPDAMQGFPFAIKTMATAVAETQAVGQTQTLIWLDVDSLILSQPDALRLPDGQQLGYRPVDHTLIGSIWDEPVDDFWSLIYEHCHVPVNHLFPMTTSVDQKRIRPYFNAGILVVRPENNVLRYWADSFRRLYRHPALTPFYEQSDLYAIFVHQAILTGTILANFAPESLHLLPRTINYPLHMHADYPIAHRPVALNELTTCRYDFLFDKTPNWQTKITINEPLKSWLNQHL